MAASREEVYERVKEVLTEQLGVEESEINQEASFQEDLDADSLDLVELIMELEDQFGIKISDETPRRSRRSARQSTTSRRTSRPPTGALAELIAALPPERRGRGLHPFELGRGAQRVVRAARVPRRLGARAGDRAHALRAVPGLQRGADGEAPLARRLACELRRSSRRSSGSASGCSSAPPARRARGARAARARTATCSPRCSRRRSRRSTSSTASRRWPARSSRRSRAGSSTRSRNQVDHKTELQETLARSGRCCRYALLDAEGPPHERHVHRRRGDRRRGGRHRRGTSKKDAEQDAAREALERLERRGRASPRPPEPTRRRPRRRGSLPRVHLKAIKLRGFKSFVDPVEVRLEPGVAVVSGRTAPASRTSPTRSSGRPAR